MYKEMAVKNKPISKDLKNFMPISAQLLREKFGSTSYIYFDTKDELKFLWEELKNNPSVMATMDKWANTMETFYGYKPDISLFLDHVYLNILAKIAVYLKFECLINMDKIIDVISGKYFTAKGIINFVGEEDVSLWVLNHKIENKSLPLLYSFFKSLAEYDFSETDEDIFKEIYEEIINCEERHKAGEYYTPEWLVQLTLENVFALWEEKKEGIPKILDPACGSGTFLYRVIKCLIKKGAFLKDIVKNVAGMDINPIATIIAKTNYLMAISNLIKGSEKIILPIYRKDSLNFQEEFDYGITIDKYDIIVGNPPWIVMRSMKNKEYQNFLKRETLNYGLLRKKDVHLFTQMELATLFFCKCADLYLKKDGIIAFVMPRSVLAGTIHHVNFRKFRKPAIKIAKIIDLEKVSPLFNMPSCVLIGLKGGTTKYPVLLEKYIGELPSRNVKFSQVNTKLFTEISKYIPPDFSSEPSYYYDKFKVGASIFPRSLYFVDIIFYANSQATVKTSREIYQMVKEPWKILLEGIIEKDFLYATLLAWEIIPFGYIKLRPVILPIREYSKRYKLLNSFELQKEGFVGIGKWFNKAQDIWCKVRTEKSEKRFPSLLDRLNYNNLLLIQNPSKRYSVLYNATGTNLFSCVIDKLSLPYFIVDGGKIQPKGFIADVKTWFFETENDMEAYYLSAVFNSEVLSEIIKPLQPKGLFGARAVHRRPLLFAIPKFDSNNYMHLRLAYIGEKCHEEVKAMKFEYKNNIRKEIKGKFKSEITEINQIVLKILNISEGEK